MFSVAGKDEGTAKAAKEAALAEFQCTGLGEASGRAGSVVSGVASLLRLVLLSV